jgi:L-ascorbate metabolism protein UlaG (beta-lactamase superfamily)
MKLTWRGHAFFEIETRQGVRIAIDPFVENGLTKVKAADVRPDFVLVTHGHGDHLGSAAEINKPTLCIYEISSYLASKGVRGAVGMNIGGSYEFKGVKFTMTNAVHSSGIEGGEVYGGNPCGWVIDDGEHRVYHAGDTGLFGDMRSVIGEVHKPDVALLPIGGHFTMDAAQAAIAATWLGVKTIVPMHYNTFDKIRADPVELIRALPGKKVIVMKPDETVVL